MGIITQRPITKRRANFLVKATCRLNIHQTDGLPDRSNRNNLMDFRRVIRFNGSEPMSFERPMKKLALVIFLTAWPALPPAWAQTKLMPKSAAVRADPCAPIGRTADGKLVYSMKCENLPAPIPPPQAEIREPPPPPQAEIQRSGLFGWSYEVKRPDQ
jgi:hypothetical protein